MYVLAQRTCAIGPCGKEVASGRLLCEQCRKQYPEKVPLYAALEEAFGKLNAAHRCREEGDSTRRTRRGEAHESK